MLRSRVALWDVLASAERQGSLDSAIAAAEAVMLQNLQGTWTSVQTANFHDPNDPNGVRRTESITFTISGKSTHGAQTYDPRDDSGGWSDSNLEGEIVSLDPSERTFAVRYQYGGEGSLSLVSPGTDSTGMSGFSTQLLHKK